MYGLDNVEIEALCQALSLNVDVAYLNGSRGDRVDFIKFSYDSNAEAPPLVLLYRYVIRYDRECYSATDFVFKVLVIMISCLKSLVLYKK